MNLLNYLLAAVILSIIPGQLIRISIFSQSGAISLTDIMVFIFDYFFVNIFLLSGKKIKIPPFILFPVSLFIIWSFISLVLASLQLPINQVLISSTFLLRYILYFLFFIGMYNIFTKETIFKWINLILITGFIFTVIGFIQFFFYSDFSALTYYGWDPHQKRLTSTLLDPNFAGIIFAILSAFSIALFLKFKKNIYIINFAFLFIAQILTFSRSTYLALLVILFIIGILKSPKILIVSLLFFALAIVVIPQTKSRIIGAFTIDETSVARIESWENALYIFQKQPIFGVGFNSYRFVQANYGFFESDNPFGGHSGSGVDSSLLLIAATTGVGGLLFYGTLIISLLHKLLKGAKQNILYLAGLASLCGLLVHSQFVNSLFYPQILIFWWLLPVLTLTNDN